jgi:hypothetical protein
MNKSLDVHELDDVDLFDLTVIDVAEEAAAFAVNEEGGGCVCSCSCDGAPGCT